MWLETGETDEPIALKMFESLLESTAHPDIETYSTPAPTYNKYYALSYVWDTETELMPFTVNGRAFRIKPNLHSFLKHCREKRRARCLAWPILDGCYMYQSTRPQREEWCMMDKNYGTGTLPAVSFGSARKTKRLSWLFTYFARSQMLLASPKEWYTGSHTSHFLSTMNLQPIQQISTGTKHGSVWRSGQEYMELKTIRRRFVTKIGLPPST